jgi:hypothetical protein
MVVNFMARGISRNARKLAQTSTLIYIKKKRIKDKKSKDKLRLFLRKMI